MRVVNASGHDFSYTLKSTDKHGIRPSIHLKSTVKILSGYGTKLDSYVVGL